LDRIHIKIISFRNRSFRKPDFTVLMRVGGPGTKITPEQRTESIKLIENNNQKRDNESF